MTSGIELLLVLVLVLVLLGFALNRFVVRMNRLIPSDRISEAFPADEIVREQRLASFLGLGSTGTPQPRNLGTLVLARDRLQFLPADRDAELVVHMSDVRSVDLVSTHVGMMTGKPLLSVTFDTPHGPDVAAFHLPYPHEWQRAIMSLI